MRDEHFPIVAVGASAGGLEPFLSLLRNVPADARLAIIYLQHSDSRHLSELPQIFGRATKIPVRLAADTARVEPNVIYVAPPDGVVTFSDGVLRVEPRGDRPGMPIDALLRSLAFDQGSRAISVILSGTASDGTLGSKAIKAEGGITFAQDETARFDGMPRSAIAAGAIDFVLPPEEIASEIVRIARHSYVANDGDGDQFDERDLTKVFNILRSSHDVDFTHYKPPTIDRRIRRRMALQKTETLSEYIRILREKPEEVEHLYSDILIRVTSFFRDPEVFTSLQENVLPELVRRHGDRPVRIWVPGCATGEEVYSLAIIFQEALAALQVECPVQVFGTDLSDASIDRARGGMYPDSIAAEVSTERLRQFFTRVDGGYRVAKKIRDCCIFARQNLTKDPPFSKVDLISCRNVLIYLGAVLQRRVMNIFHYALQPHGYLLLGNSETIGSYADTFSIVDRRNKIYQRKGTVGRLPMDLTKAVIPASGAHHESIRPLDEDTGPAPNVFREADRVLLARYSPAGVLIDNSMEILQFRGRTSPFLEPAPGTASFNVMKMAREGLLAELRTAIHTAGKKDVPVRRERIPVTTDGHIQLVNMEVIPFIGPHAGKHFIVLFEIAAGGDKGTKRRGKAAPAPPAETKQSVRLKRELEATRDYLQSIIEEQEAMNEELRSANEEIQSSNEELQSTNEELETAKEELQSSNEELMTLNEELERRNDELAQSNSDLINLLGSVDLPIVMLDSGLHIRRFNPGAQRVLNLIGSDTGRSIRDLKLTLDVDDLDQMIGVVIDTLEMREMHVRDRNGHNYMLRIRPYKTSNNKIDGAVLVLIDIDQLKKA
ncbi:MAG: PAS domain-containing protein [Acidobacteria bacterium]|nr:PAS domain-containing protein [Acidobacteriota bacterium]